MSDEPAAPVTERPHWVELPITLELTDAVYTVALSLGSEQATVQLILDTGSSSLAVLPGRYDPTADRSLQATPWAQPLAYGQGAWVGPVVRSDLRLDSGHHLAATDLAVIEAESTDFHGADGILGLAYRPLDLAHEASALLPPPTTQSWPWPFSAQQSAEPAFASELRQQPSVQLVPAFSALEEHGVVADRFALLIRRALRRAAGDDGSHRDNQGRLLLGAGEELLHLHDGDLQTLPVLHDRYYNVQLRALQVEEQAPISAPPLRPAEEAGYASNAIIDTGCSFILLEDSLYQGLLDGLNRIDSRLGAAIEAFGPCLAQQRGLIQPGLAELPWPPLWLHFDGHDGQVASVRLDPQHYWQHDGLRPGESWFMLLRQLPDWPRQSVLGLPLLCDHYVVFDRRVDGLGVIRLAAAKSASHSQSQSQDQSINHKGHEGEGPRAQGSGPSKGRGPEP